MQSSFIVWLAPLSTTSRKPAARDLTVACADLVVLSMDKIRIDSPSVLPYGKTPSLAQGRLFNDSNAYPLNLNQVSLDGVDASLSFSPLGA